jgi:hypothetical protein
VILWHFEFQQNSRKFLWGMLRNQFVASCKLGFIVSQDGGQSVLPNDSQRKSSLPKFKKARSVSNGLGANTRSQAYGPSCHPHKAFRFLLCKERLTMFVCKLCAWLCKDTFMLLAFLTTVTFRTLHADGVFQFWGARIQISTCAVTKSIKCT